MSIYKCSIIADPESANWDFAVKVYENLKKRSNDFELNKVIIKKFRDGEIKPKIELNVRRKNCFFIHDSNKQPSEWFMELCLINHTLRNSSAHEIINVFPYLKFSRQDRKDESRVPITARAFADVVGQNADKVLTLDVHNPAIQGFYSIPFDNLYSFAIVIDHITKNHPEILKDVVIMSPDAGGAPRAKAFAKRLGSEEVAIGYKTREIDGEVGSLKILGDVSGKKVLIIDDIIDSGGTLIKACEAVRQQGAKEVYVYCTHGLFSKGIEKITCCFDRIFVGDTIKQEKNEKIEVISFVPLFAEAIYRLSEGESLSELFL